jgi:hypothetical protein
MNNRPTPDFMAKTTGNENIVFESKGGTAWQSHLQQRKQAVKQLAKIEQGGTSAWSGTGRAFACSLFTAQQGDERSSLFHVEDPVFGFDDLFKEGGEEASRRSHCLGILEGARLFDLADDMRRTRRERRQAGENQVFDLPEPDRTDERHRFVGTYLPIEQWIRQLRHPEPDALRNLRIFVGVEQRTYARLERGEIPVRPTVPDEKAQGEAEPLASSKVGVLSHRETTGEARGVYSVLSDGSFLAVEFE